MKFGVRYKKNSTPCGDTGANMGKNENLNFLDLSKFLLSFCVIAIHVQPFINIENKVLYGFYEAIVRCAVPIFFLASGYLLSRKFKTDSLNKEVVKRYIKANLKLYIKWTIIYLPITIIHFINTGTGTLKAVGKFVYNFVVVGQNYNSWPLWYLLSTVYAAIFILFCIKRGSSIKKIAIIGAIFILVGISLNVFYDMQFDNSMVDSAKHILHNIVPDGRIFGGFFYIPLGIYIEKKWRERPNKDQDVKKLIISSILLLIMRAVLNDTFLAEYITVLYGVTLFLLILCVKLRDRSFYKILRKVSMYNYLLHMLVWTILYMLFYGTKTCGIFMFIITSIVTTAISCAIVFLKKLYDKHHELSLNKI